MFSSICIKSKELNKQKIDISFLIEAMLFYGKVIVLAQKNELVTLLSSFGEEFLEELIKTGRINLQIREDILASMAFPNDRYSVDLFAKDNEDFSKILYQAHREITKSSTKNLAFSNKFSKIVEPFTYGNNLVSQIRNDFNNKELLEKLIPIYFKEKVPNVDLPEELEIEIIKDKSFGPFDAYSLNTNLDLDAINETHKQNDPDNFYPINYSGFFLALAESKGDIFIASTFESELVTNDLYSKFIEVELTEIIQRRIQSQENLDLFDEYVLTECYSIGDAFMNGMVSKKELLALFEKADRFREWLLQVPDDKNIIGEYHNAVTTKTFADKLPTKTTRFVLFEGLGITLDLMGGGGIGTAIATGLAAFDGFYLDKLINGWRPNHFVDKN